MKIIILAGGSGTRLWPLSRDRYPKQFIKLQDKKESLFQESFKRSLLLADGKDIYVVTNKKYKFLVMGEINELDYEYDENNILVESEAKGTLPAIYAGISEIQKNGDDTVVVFPSDHIIINNRAFVDLIKNSEIQTDDSLITFGIKPDGPNTGYGYISPGVVKGNGYTVTSFKEKPTREKATQYIEKGYYWNAGIFMFNSKLFVEEAKKYVPEIYQAFQFSKDLNESFSKIKTNISIDYGIMEKSKKVVVVPADCGWNDLGSFDSFYNVFDKDENNNATRKENILIDSVNNLVLSNNGKIVAAVGVNDLIIIDNRDALLVCKKNQSQKVKDVVEILKKRKDKRTEYHVYDYRPWGHYRILEEREQFKIKRITVNQDKKLSYQLHHHRSEHWIVVRGMARVTIDEEVQFVRAGESIDIKAGQKHQLENPGKIPLEIIEIQMGAYLEEDDIVRFGDDYGRE
ncbi:mannose-1-phosphate guanylyltransferase/mannose-6-phosphate isomerase [Acetobacterium fimetarium]|uniref:mannose-1-phosphate guanylyltransferase n=1 Tax=Acetobacterium fimetarium TaxID=52691 RepID=A0ABR6WYC9_9FIRM|nr:mannose-1-phosphate guanylyltransferase/mannose-6-phosphate isomerase [Acetobacterium fimetarium]MBC3805614.1 mannose-1-phosphate guanylyltransferase/mannose-6-phosphate isomerase [Acetobacterium fimetarium]